MGLTQDEIMGKWPGITKETIAYFSYCAKEYIVDCKRCGRFVTFSDIMRAIMNKHRRFDQDALPSEARGTIAQLANYDAKTLAIHNNKYKPSCQRPCCGPWARQQVFLTGHKPKEEREPYYEVGTENDIDAYLVPEYSSSEEEYEEAIREQHGEQAVGSTDSTPYVDPDNGGYWYCGEHYAGVWHGTAYAILKNDVGNDSD